MNKNSYTQNNDEQRTQQQFERTKREPKGGSEMREDVGEGEGGLPLARIKEVGRNLGEQLEVQMSERPYVVVGAALGLGFAAGSLLGSRLGQIAIAITAGYLMRNAIKDSGKVQRMVKEGIDKLAGDRSAG